MAAIARVLSNASGTDIDVEALRAIVILCGIGLVVSLLLAGGADYLGFAPNSNELNMMVWI
jgi:hypothetical protein